MTFSETCYSVFRSQVEDWHRHDSVHEPYKAKPGLSDFDELLYHKNWIDTVQWHLEDIIRDPGIDAAAALDLKRWIDRSNQDRTDMVERIDDYFWSAFKDVVKAEDAGINTETPAWALDRLSILALKIYHMEVECSRKDASEEHIRKCSDRLNLLKTQLCDLCTAIDCLIEELRCGRKYMKLYRQVKMYNDPALNPVLYAKK